MRNYMATDAIPDPATTYIFPIVVLPLLWGVFHCSKLSAAASRALSSSLLRVWVCRFVVCHESRGAVERLSTLPFASDYLRRATLCRVGGRSSVWGLSAFFRIPFG